MQNSTESHVDSIIESLGYAIPIIVCLFGVLIDSGLDINVINSMFGSGALFASSALLLAMSVRNARADGVSIVIFAIAMVVLLFVQLLTLILSIRPIVAPGFLNQNHFILLIVSSIVFSIAAGFRKLAANVENMRWLEDQ